MARTGRVNHTHQYYRHANGLWHCSGIEGCSHYVPKNMPEPAGRMSLCWSCNKPFLLTPTNMEVDKPKCDACSSMDDVLEDYLEKRMPKKPDMIAEISRQAREAVVKAKAAQSKKDEPDQIEVIEPTLPEVVHDDDCEIYIGMACSCR